jgi:cell fate (sporulation/competence/biofilm development) regulator YlbF (YheA/YmcA/DUF963 family)
MNQSIAEQTKEARILIYNSRQHAGIRQALVDFGYPIENLEKGQALLEHFLLLQSTKRQNYGAKLNATETVVNELQQLKDAYDEHFMLARLAFKQNRGLQKTLGLTDACPTRRAALVEQIANFYEQLLPNHAAVKRYGLTRAEIEQAQASVAAFIQLQQQQAQRKGEAQSATQQRNQALKNLQQWVRGYRAIVRVALTEQPQLLEVLGLLVRM